MGLFVEAIFNGIDGEANGFWGAGQLSTFIRLKGCNLRCEYCDTKYAQEVTDEDKPMEVEEILKWPDLLNKVTITGGEPLIQKDCNVLITKLLVMGHKITVETNGTMPIEISNNLTRFVVDYKLPSSGMEGKMNPEVFKCLCDNDVVKFVIADYDDYYAARGLATMNNWTSARKVFSPAIIDQKDYTGWPATLAQLMIEDANVLGDVQFSLQIHKVLWPDSEVER
jgi:7-carboxy-7-deazaguanine synthase